MNRNIRVHPCILSVYYWSVEVTSVFSYLGVISVPNCLFRTVMLTLIYLSLSFLLAFVHNSTHKIHNVLGLFLLSIPLSIGDLQPMHESI